MGFFAQCVFAQSNFESTNSHANRTVTYCIDPSWEPYEAIRNGQHVGISAQYLKLISEKIGVTFQLVPTESWQQSLEFVQLEKCQAIPMINPRSGGNIPASPANPPTSITSVPTINLQNTPTLTAVTAANIR